MKMKFYLKATELLHKIIILANDIDQNNGIERESQLATLHTYCNDIAKMLYLDMVDVTQLENIEKSFKRFLKQI